MAGSTIHAVDASSFAASDQTPGVMGNMILDTLDMQVTGTPVGVTRGASASSTGWIEGFGGRRRYGGNSATMAFTSETYGVMAGRSLDAMSGLFVGAARNTTASDRTFDNRSDSVFAGYHSRYDLGGIEMDASLTFGAAQNNTSRRIANNTVLTGLETARGQYMSYFLMPSATFRGDWDFGDTGFETSVRVRYAAMHDQGYTETGSAAAMTVDGRTSHLGEVRLQVDGALLDQVTACGVFMANLRLGADVQYLDNEHVSGSVAGQSIAFATNGDRVSRRAFAGLNIMHSMADGTRELRGGFEVGRTQSGISDVSASLRWQMRF
ncbi:MAG: autotransporter outer membrane beta-barrel domain-containing protein [Orrella sp.]